MRTLEKVRERFWWKNMENLVRENLKKCPVCVLERVSRLRGRGGKHGTYQVTRRGEILALDVLSITPESMEGYKKFLVMAYALTWLC